MGRVLMVLALVTVSAGCNESFECASDSHCERDGVAGFCESVGHCSFPDDTCETGRRFGELAGTLSNMCVPPPDDGSTSASSATSTTSTAESSDVSSTTPVETAAGSSSSTTSEADSSTGPGEVADCTLLVDDSFEGDALADTWGVQGSPTVSAGAVRFAINPDSVGVYERISALEGSKLNLGDGWVTLHLEAIPQIIHTQGTLTLVTDTGEVMALYENGNIRPFVGGDSLDHQGTTAPWVRVGFEGAGGQAYDVVFLESEDGNDWTEIARAPEAAIDPTGVRVELTAGSWDAFAIPQEYAVRSVQVCGRSGL